MKISIYREANPTSMPYSVTEHGSHPDLENDDCWAGTDHATLADAEAAFAASFDQSSTAWIMLEGDDGSRHVRVNPDYVSENPTDDWRMEHAMQIGMGLGVEAYNDAMETI